jgi:hypothetical protein
MKRRPFPPYFAFLVAAVMFSSSAKAGLIAFDSQTPLVTKSNVAAMSAMLAATDSDSNESMHQAPEDGMSMSIGEQSGVGGGSPYMIASNGILISKPVCCCRLGADGNSRLPETIPISLLKVPIAVRTP